ncbi:hypothetical protein [Phyllobacterium sp. P30BS-XVII]|uniref:hypothetical protein n=1 Tax=Phyllobacterium sp. P30BS-XVII TaxID=2587046 RepID=UPI0015FD0ACA|nr:hypothetical protein [Phyllobacterium sp. P30BS-XVII]MBA8902489.1 hypothetical protein [Phyllobacterium sp. P30BS-XVII]
MNYRHLILSSVTGLALSLTPALAQEAKKPEPPKQETGAKPAAPAVAAPEAPATKEAPVTKEAPAAKEAAEAPNQSVPDYLDDRSTPEQLVKSYYNAINRQEYARAYSYYAEEGHTQAFPQFQAGYENTVSVELRLGKVESEGAAGSTYWSLPLAIESTQKDGKRTVYNGCYRLRLANAAIQGVPFVPLSILDGTLQKFEKPLDQSVPEACEAP